MNNKLTAQLRKPLAVFSVMLLTTTMIGLLTGCDSSVGDLGLNKKVQTTADAGTKDAKEEIAPEDDWRNTGVSSEYEFSLPKKWETEAREPGGPILKARLLEEGKDNEETGPVMLSYVLHTGTEEDAKQKTLKAYKEDKEYADKILKDPESAGYLVRNPEYKVLKLAGKNVYVEQIDTNAAVGAFYWYSRISFVEDNAIITIILTDKAENQIPALTEMIKTFHFNKEEGK